MTLAPLISSMGPSAEEEAATGFGSRPYTPPAPPPEPPQPAPAIAQAPVGGGGQVAQATAQAAPLYAPPVGQVGQGGQYAGVAVPAPAVQPSLLNRVGNFVTTSAGFGTTSNPAIAGGLGGAAVTPFQAQAAYNAGNVDIPGYTPFIRNTVQPAVANAVNAPFQAAGINTQLPGQVVSGFVPAGALDVGLTAAPFAGEAQRLARAGAEAGGALAGRALENTAPTLEGVVRPPAAPFRPSMRFPREVTSGEPAMVGGGMGYENVPDSLMGFRKSGFNKGYGETNYPFSQPVKVTFPGEEPFYDEIKGMNQPHALERARRNWEGADVEAVSTSDLPASGFLAGGADVPENALPAPAASPAGVPPSTSGEVTPPPLTGSAGAAPPPAPPPLSDLEKQMEASLAGKKPPAAAPVTVGEMRAVLDANGLDSSGNPSQIISRYKGLQARGVGGVGTPTENVSNAARDAYRKTLEATGDPGQATQAARTAARIETQTNNKTNALIQAMQDLARDERGSLKLGGNEPPRSLIAPPDKLSDLPKIQAQSDLEKNGLQFGQSSPNRNWREATGELPKEGPGPIKRTLDELLGLAGLPQTLMSQADISGIGRQGSILGIRHPEEWAKMTAATVKAFGSEEAATAATNALHESRWYNLLKDAGLKEYEYGAGVAPGERVPGYTGINESIVGKALGGEWKIGGKTIPNVVRASERAYATGLNVEGFNVAEKYLQTIWDQMHARPGAFDAAEFAKQAKGVVDVVNHARGYGTGTVANVMSSTHAFFSGRNFISKFQLLLDPITKPGSLLEPSARRMAAENLASFITANLGFMGFMAATGALAGGAWSVQTDPRSTDWGKVKFGNTHVDTWNGMAPLVRLIAREATGETKNSKGEIQPTYRPAELLRFFQNKESPAANILATKLLGQQNVGSQPGLNMQTLYNLGVPLLIQDVADALKNGGPLQAAIAGLASFVGAGVTSYPPPTGEQRDAEAQKLGLADYAAASKDQQKQINDSLGVKPTPFYTANAKTVEDMDRFLQDAKASGYGHAVTFNSLFRDVNPMDKQSMQAWNDSKAALDTYYNHIGQLVTPDALAASGYKQPARKTGKETETDEEYKQRVLDSTLTAARKLAQKNNPQLDAWLSWWSKGQQKVETQAAVDEVKRMIAKYGQ